MKSPLNSKPILCWRALLIPALFWFSHPHYAVDTVESDVPPAERTEVAVGMYVIDIFNIDGAQQLFTADVATRFSWHDPRLAESGNSPRVIPMDEIWHPKVVITNLRDVKSLLPEEAKVSPDGTVVYNQRSIGDFSCRFDLHNFPQDKQVLAIHLAAEGSKRDSVTFVPDDKFLGRAEGLTITDWAVEQLTLREKPYPVPQMGIVLPGIVAELPCQRQLAYYFGSVFATTAFILFMAWLVFWIPPDSINPRISVSVTSMLTLIAHRFVIQGDLPHLPYLTKMDYFLLGATCMVLFGLAGVIAVFKILSDGNRPLAERLNRILRWGFPFVFLALSSTLLF